MKGRAVVVLFCALSFAGCDIHTDPATNLSATSATLHGHISYPSATGGTWRWEYSRDGGATWIHTAPTPFGPDPRACNWNSVWTGQDVSKNITGLIPGSHYIFRLAGTPCGSDPQYGDSNGFEVDDPPFGSGDPPYEYDGFDTPPSLLWGAWIGNQLTGEEAPWDWNAVTAFEQQNAGGKHPSLLNWSSPFYSLAWCGGACGFKTDMFQKVRDHGVVSFFSWGNTDVSDANVAAGAKDDYIRSWASAAKSWGHPLFLRFAWEMNTSLVPWGVGNNGTTAAQYVAAWRHVHDIFQSVGASNVSWVWCPNVDPGGKFADLASVYPGDSYVDWTCLDGYNGNEPWTSFTDLYASTYDKIMQIAPSKPMIVGEVGSTESGGSKAQWITNMFAALPTRFPNIHGLLWFDKYQSGPGGYTDWPLETSSSSSAAFAAGVG